jgi:hypothetical protein
VTRAELAGRVVSVLNRGNRRNPDVLLVETPAGRFVVKDFSPRAAWVRATLGRWITAREARAYRALEGHPAVPRYAGAIDPLAFAIEYRPGRRLSRRLAGKVPPEFVDRVEEAVRDMHRRGVVHLDLRHRSNVLADDAGQPVLIDFGSALCLRPGGWPARLLLPWLARIDLAALHKWRVRLDPRVAGFNLPADGEPGGPRSGGSSPG